MNLKTTLKSLKIIPLLMGLLTLLLPMIPGGVSAQVYCNPSVGNPGYNIGMTNVTIGSINNNSNSGPNPTYNNYTNLYTAAKAGASVNFSISTGATNGTTVTIYIDWNKDGTFNTTNELVFNQSNATPSVTNTGSFTVPNGQAPGEYRIRVSGDFWPYTPSSPCANTYGEHEDYTFVVLQPNNGVDAAASRITPTNFTPGNNNLTFFWRNLGSVAITSADIGYSLDGGTAVTASYTGSLASGAGTSHTFSSPVNISAGSHLIKVWVRNPNNTYPDLSTANDTLTISFCTGLAGTYTINPTGSGTNNFKSFTEAVAQINKCGVSGPVVVNVAAGTYSEQVSLDNVNGVSATNTITFDGGAGNAATRILTYAASGTVNAHTFRINNTRYVTIKNLTLRATGSSAGNPLHLMGVASNATIKNNIITFTGNGLTAATGYPYPFRGINIANSNDITATSFCSNSPSATNTDITIDSNSIIGGTYGINFIGNSQSFNTRITNNKITEAYEAAMNLGSMNGWLISKNTIEMRASNTYSTGIQHCNGSSSGTNFYEASNNIIKAGNRSFYLLSLNPGGARTKIVNNFMYGFTSPQPNAIYFNERNFDIWHNSILISNKVNNVQAAGIYMQGGTGNDLRNNNIAITDPTAIGTPVYINAGGNGPNVFTTMEYNNFYNAASGSDLLFVDGTTYRASNIKGALGWNNTFFSKAPGFVSNNDLHYSTTIPPMYGDPTLGIQFDIDGDPRCPDAPTIGADESKYPFPKPTAGFSHPDSIFVNTGVELLNKVAKTLPYKNRWYVDGALVGSTPDLTYKFTTTGNKTVSVVTFACGVKDSFAKVITVINPTTAPVADFSVDRNVISFGESVSLRDLSSHGPNKWAWEISPKMIYDANLGTMVPTHYYDNGTDSSSQNPVIVFDFAGTYDVCLTASNSFGSSKVCKTRYIRVKENITMCSSPTNMSNSNYGILTDDGGTSANYSNNLNCNYLISPCSPTLELTIKSFNLATNDFLKIYDGADNTGAKLYDENVFPKGLTGNAATIPGFPTKMTSKTGKVYVEFMTDGSGTAPGFELEWASDSFNLTPPVAMFSAPDTVCYGLNVNFMNQSTGFGNMYYWDMDGDLYPETTVENPTDFFVNVGLNPVMLIVENCGGRDTFVKNIFVVNPLTAPTADFTADITTPNPGTDVVTFTDKSFRCVDEWNWEFMPNTVTFVNGTNASSRNPQVRFTSGGCYNVKLTVGFNGMQSDVTKNCYINAVQYCTPTVSTLTTDIGIASVTIGSMVNNSAISAEAYTDYTATHSVNITKLVSTNISVSRQTNFNSMSVAAWIDLNQDGDFEDAGERVAFDPAVRGTSWNSSFKIPLTAKTGGTRMRIGTNLSNNLNLACGTNKNGEYEDYRIFILEDKVVPVITLIGNDTVRVEAGRTYVDAGATAMDDVEGDISSRIVTTNNVNTFFTGPQIVRYNVSDSAGNKAIEVTRVVMVEADTTPAVITLTGGDTVYVEVGFGYTEPGYMAIDPNDSSDITADVTVSGSVDTAVVGTYIITYTVLDNASNQTVKQRTVIVRDTVKPVVTLNGADTVYVEIYTSYIDSGVTITDNYWKNLTAVVTSNVDTAKLGIYTVVYTVTDSSGNMTTLTRTVIVRDTQIPVITLNGPDTLTVEVFSQYFELGATVSDNFSQNINVQISGTVNTSVLGFYTITYKAVDANGNIADSVTRTVHVVDTKAPMLTLIGNEFVVIRRGETYTDSGYTVSDNYWPVSTIIIDTFTNFKNDGTDIEGAYIIRYTATDSSGNVSVVTRTISVGVNGIGEATALNGTVSIFPNPAANGMFNVDVKLAQTENVKVSIFNMLGQEIRVLHNGNLSNQRFNVQLNENAGMYFVRIQGANATVTKPVVITK